MELTGKHLCFGGEQRRYRHRAESLSCDMDFSLYLPPQARSGAVPVVYWLSGLTCTDENFVTKAGAQRAAAELGLALVAPDTSPRGDAVPDDPDGAYDFGLGAGFYVNATEAPYSTHYHMYDYVLEELPTVLGGASLPLADVQAICGHSMGGHGALTLAFGNLARFVSVSAFAPICAPSRCPWGRKALAGYLGAEESAWRSHDATQLVADVASLPVRIDQGAHDDFLEEQLKPELLLAAAAEAGVAIDYHLHDGYDHSYFFIASFIGEHLAFHAQHLRESS